MPIRLPKPPEPVREPPPVREPSGAERALSAILANAEEMARINKMLAEHLAKPAPKRSFVTEVTQRDAQGRIVSLRTIEG